MKRLHYSADLLPRLFVQLIKLISCSVVLLFMNLEFLSVGGVHS